MISRHCDERLYHRFGLELSSQQLAQLAAACQLAPIVKRQPDGKTHRAIVLIGRSYSAVVDESGVVVTLLRAAVPWSPEVAAREVAFSPPTQ